jgi:hypothetical protein
VDAESILTQERPMMMVNYIFDFVVFTTAAWFLVLVDINLLVAFTFLAGIGGTTWCLTSDLVRAWQAWRHRRKLRSILPSGG